MDVPDAVEVIKQDHQVVGQLFQQYQVESEPSAKARLVEQITQGLAQHAEMEETILYPAMQDVMGKAQMAENVDEHNTMRRLLGQLGSMSPDAPDYDQTVQELMTDVLAHVRLEEEDELPQVQQALGQEKLDQLGSDMEEFKRRSG
jgi:hemerythrin superfamily protein